ncbi:MAG TPA: hypothetical protein VF282_09970 [Bacillota bacterium]
MSSLLQLVLDPQLLLATVTALMVFGTAAFLVQALWSGARAALRRNGSRGITAAALPWLLGSGVTALITGILWFDYIAVFRPGPDLAAVLTVRSAVLKLILVGFAKAILIALLVVLLYPVLHLGQRRGPRPGLARLEALWRRWVPKAAPYLVYYALLAVVVSLVTDGQILGRLPDVPVEVVARNLQDTLTIQVREMQTLILGLFGG